MQLQSDPYANDAQLPGLRVLYANHRTHSFQETHTAIPIIEDELAVLENALGLNDNSVTN